MSGEVSEVLRGRESEVGLGGLSRRAGPLGSSQAEVKMHTFSIKTDDARIAADTTGRHLRTMTRTPATSLRRC